MISFLFDLVIGGLLSVALFLFGLFPSVNPEDFALSPPDGVREALSALNWFVPISDMMAVFGIWLTLVLVANAVAAFRALTEEGERYARK